MQFVRVPIALSRATLGAFSLLAATSAQAATFSVSSTLDVGPGTLRQAITDANAAPGADAIAFNIPGPANGVRTINLLSELPPITDPVVIDGYTQPGSTPNSFGIGNSAQLLIEVSGGNIVDDGIQLDTNDSLVRGLILNRFAGDAITIGEGGGADVGKRNLITGNFIGTDAAGTGDAGSLGDGISIFDGDSDGNRIGGASPEERNVISGNGANGIEIRGDSNTVANNFIGTDRSGLGDLGNDDNGIFVSGANNVIGGSQEERNVISGNTLAGAAGTEAGVLITGAGAVGNRIVLNFIGVNVGGDVRPQSGLAPTPLEMANDTGVLINMGASGNLLSNNVISGNTLAGVVIAGPGTRENVLRQNFIGPDLFARPVVFTVNNPVLGARPTASQGTGVLIQLAATRNTVGGAVGEGNLISGNATAGIVIQNLGTNENLVRANRIGTNAAGDGPLAGPTNPEAVQDSGIHVRLVARFNTIGFGPDADPAASVPSGNVIAFNDNDGVLFGGTGQFAGDNTDANPTRFNSIFSNGGEDGIGLGINVDSSVQGQSGVFEAMEGTRPFNTDLTSNDPAPGDDDTGPNNEQNFPTIESARIEASGVVVRGSFNSERLSTFLLDFYANQRAQGFSNGLPVDPSGYGEGERYVGTVQVTTDLMGNARFEGTLSGSVPRGQFLSATATKIRGGEETTQPSPSTGEFARAVEVTMPGVLQLSTASTSTAEGTSTATITVTRTGGSDGAISVPVVVSSGSATRGSDFSVPTPQGAGVSVAANTPEGSDTVTLSFAAGETSKSFSVSILDDSADEPVESLNLALRAPTGASLGSLVASTISIQDNDATPGIVQFSTPSITQLEGTSTATITVTRGGGSDGTVSVPLVVSGDSATRGVDFEVPAAQGAGVSVAANTPAGSDTVTLSFAPGETSRSFSVRIIEDSVDEADEIVNITLGTPTGGTVGGAASSTLRIQDNDATPGIVQLATSTFVQNEGAATALITVTRGGGGDGAVSVPVVVSGGSATRGSDFEVSATQGVGVSVASNTPAGSDTVTLQFAPGETTRTFAISLLNDRLNEAGESINLALGAPTGASIGAQATATLQIQDDDARPALSVNDVSVVEGDSGATQAVFTISLSAPSGQSLSVDVRTADGTARANSDYGPVSGTLTFAPGVTSQTVSVPVIGEIREEQSEYFQLLLLNNINADIARNRARATIIEAPGDDDQTPPRVLIATPRNGTTPSSLALISGSVFDLNASGGSGAGSGVRQVEVLIFNGRAGYFNGTTFSPRPTILRVALQNGKFTLRTRLAEGSSTLREGTYIITVRAVDARGNRSQSQSRVLVDTQAPIVNITTPSDGARITELPLVAGTARDTLGGSGVRRVVVFIGRASDRRFFNGTSFVASSTALATDYSPSTRRFSRRTGLPSASLLTPGRYVLTVKAIDGAGRVASRVINVYVGAASTSGAAPGSTPVPVRVPSVKLSAAKALAAHSNARLALGRARDAAKETDVAQSDG